jgi:predicted nucleotidyltransferase
LKTLFGQIWKTGKKEVTRKSTNCGEIGFKSSGILSVQHRALLKKTPTSGDTKALSKNRNIYITVVTLLLHMFQECDIWKLMNLFFDCPSKKFHLRELARTLKWGPGRVERNMKSLVSKSLVNERTEKNLRLFSANKANEEFKLLKRCYNIYALKDFVSFLNERLVFPQAIILYGSGAHGEDDETSDIDIFVIGREKELDVNKFEARIKRKLHVIFENDIKTVKKNPKLLNNLVNGVILSGYLKVIE